jgi:hypothetical protein
VSSLVATFTLSAQATAAIGATAQVSARTANDFTSAKTYTITAGDGSTNTWTVTITIAAGSSDATLSTNSTIKGQVLLGLGTPSATMASASGGTVTISAAQAANVSNSGTYITSFSKTTASATVNKVVKYASGASTANFSTDTAYANQAITSGDFFIVKITAQDPATILYYKITVTIGATPPPSTSSLAQITTSAGGSLITLTTVGGNVYTTINEGTNWVKQAGSGSRFWASVASSTDGTKLVASEVHPVGSQVTAANPNPAVKCCSTLGDIFTSTDSGVTWTDRTAAGTRNWGQVASSADGTKLVAVEVNGGIWVSSNSGSAWSTTGSPTGAKAWSSVCSDGTGTYLAATVRGGNIWTSGNGGTSWTERTTPGARLWSAISCNSDSAGYGVRLVAAPVATPASPGGEIWTSTDGGSNWTSQLGSTSVAGSSPVWSGLASDSKGQNIVAIVQGGYIYTSKDGGVSWWQQTAAGVSSWNSVTTYADGAGAIHIAALAFAGKGIAIFTRVSTPATFNISTTAVTARALLDSVSISSTITAGSITSYALTPSIPSGLSFNTSIGSLSGIPTTVASSATYTITATGPTGSSTKTFTLTVTTPLGTTGPGGGKIFYYSPTGFTETGAPCASNCHILEWAPVSWATSLTFNATLGANAGTNSKDPLIAWSANQNTLAGAAHDEFGYGFSNTKAMSNQSGAGSAATNAGLAAEAFAGTDNSGGLWFLPSYAELATANIFSKTVAGGFNSAWYSTSSEANSATFAAFDFSGAYGHPAASKSWFLAVRPIRAW